MNMKTKVKLKKAASALLAVCLVAGVCTSCGGNTASQDKTQLSVANWPSTEGADLERMTGLKEKFEKENPNIEIVPDTWTFELQSFYPKAAAGMLADLFVAPFTEVDKLISGDYAADMTEALKKNGYYDLLNQQILDVISRDGKIYAFPYEAYNIGIIYNTEMFEAAGLTEADGTPMQPKTWEEYAEFAVRIKEATGKPGIVLMTSNNTGGWMFTNISWSFGVDFMEQQEDGSWKATFNTPEAAEALQFVKDLRWKYDVLPANVLIDQPEAMKTMATGGAGMVMGGAANMGMFAQYEMQPDLLGIMPIPAGPKAHVSLLGGGTHAVSATASEDKIEAALSWLDFVGSGGRFDDEVKQSLEERYQSSVEKGESIGAQALSIWNDNSEKKQFEDSLIQKYSNMKPNAVKLYNESLTDSEITLHPEEPIACQDLYALLDACIQQVLTNEDADCAQIMEKANSDFQTNYLDNLDY